MFDLYTNYRAATQRLVASQERVESLRNELNTTSPKNLTLKYREFNNAKAQVKVYEEAVQIARDMSEGKRLVARVVNPRSPKRLRRASQEALEYSVRAQVKMEKSIKKTIDVVNMPRRTVQKQPVIYLRDSATDYVFLDLFIKEMARLRYNLTAHNFWLYSRTVLANLKQARGFFKKGTEPERKTWLKQFATQAFFGNKHGTPPKPYDDSIFPDVNRDEFKKMLIKLYPLGKDLRQHFRVFIGDKVKKNFFKLLPTDEIKIAWLNRDVLYFKGDGGEDLDHLLAYEYGEGVSFHGVGGQQFYDDGHHRQFYDEVAEDGPPNGEDGASDDEACSKKFLFCL